MGVGAWLIRGLVVLGIGLTGCGYSGLSVRETGSQNYSTYVYALYDADPGAFSRTAAASPALVLPAPVAVAQVGEVTPPTELLEILRAEPDLFPRVGAIPGIAAQPAIEIRHLRAPEPDVSSDPARRQISRMRQVARDLQMDYLLLVGGTLDQSMNSTWLSLFDLTILGAFIVPSQKIHATARASAALIDVETGRVVLIASAEADRSKLASSVAKENDRAVLLERVRDDVIQQLAQRVVADCRHRSAAPAGADRQQGVAP